MKLYVCAALAAMMPLTAFAHDGMAVEDAYVRSTNPKTAGAFMVLDNHRKVACTLVGASSDAAERVELHTHQEADGIMKMMKDEDGFPIDPEARHALDRGGDHIMMMGLTQPLADGDVVKLVLDFGDCGTLDVEAPVDNQRTPAEASMDMGEMDHSSH
ncbi:copper chaperone PCu(A)C [Paracoccus sp. 11-3]|uniref:Copper chaperone PCu(A)C n=1 Tax=Paracoccus amoyensis TaxID=2760093 RepID=A0A926JDS8_9RHOB|nr:copper chaperone PCu(A)C [Paracoccus amoyensis]MBC9247343.1 copper chaperone PCu(A)C [Paracoccus amoyensis]